MAEFRLSFTKDEIDERLGKIDNLVSTVNGVAPDENGNVVVQGGAASWNDLTDRPFYEDEPTLTEIFSATNIEFEAFEDWCPQCYVEITPELFEILNSSWTNMTVVWDGVTYVCERYDDGEWTVCGNFDIFLNDNDNGMPFMIEISLEYGEIYIDSIRSLNSTENEFHNVSIAISKPNIIKLDPKYLHNPSWNQIENKPFGNQFYEGQILLDTILTIDANGNWVLITDMDIHSVQRGMRYQIILNDVEYEGICLDNYDQIDINDNNGNRVAGISANKEYNEIWFWPDSSFMSGTELHIQVIATEWYYSTIDPNWLPNGLNKIPVVNENYNGQVLMVNYGEWTLQDPASGLPSVGMNDAGKFLRVNSNGVWVAETIPNAEEGTF